MSRFGLWNAWKAHRERRGTVGFVLTIAGALGLLLGAGCVADTMRGFVGQDINAVMLSYGPPLGQYDLGEGSRAFQWSRISVDTTPATAVETTSRDRKGRQITTTQFVGGSETVNRCLYTFLTAWNAPRQTWVVTGFRPPTFDCALGDLG